MKTSVMQPQFLTAVQAVQRAVDNKASINALTCILLEAQDGQMNIGGTQLDFAVQKWIEAKTEHAGKALIDTKALIDALKLFPEERIDLELDPETNKLALTCGKTTIRLASAPVDTFPPLPERYAVRGTLDASRFFEAIESVGVFAAREDNRPILQAINVAFTADCIEVAAADGYRLAVDKLPMTVAQELPQMNIPAHFAKELRRVFGNVSDLSIGYRVDEVDRLINGKMKRIQIQYVQFATADTVATLLLLDGKFPEYRTILPKTTKSSAVLNRSEAITTYKRVVPFVKERNYALNFVAEAPNTFRIVGKGDSGSEIETSLDALIAGELSDGMANGMYILEALKVLKGEHVRLDWTQDAPLLMRPTNTEYPLLMIMPFSRDRSA